MNAKGIDVKERIRAVIVEWYKLKMPDQRLIDLRAILDDLDAAELRKCPKCGNEDEPLQACDHCGHTWYATSKLDRGTVPAEPPKPTGEQLKAIGKVFKYPEPRECKEGDCVWAGNSWIICDGRVASREYIGKLRWHLKDAPPDAQNGVERQKDKHRRWHKKLNAEIKSCSQLALMICNHAGECGMPEGMCKHKTKHSLRDDCGIFPCSVFPDAVCVPWVEPVKHWECEECGGAILKGACANCWDPSVRKDGACLRRNWTPKQPEPAAPEPHGKVLCPKCSENNKRAYYQLIYRIRGKHICENCGRIFWVVCTPVPPEPDAPVKNMERCPYYTCLFEDRLCKDCPHSLDAKEPKAEPGLVMTMRQEIENVLAFLRNAPHAEFCRENLIAFCENLLKHKG